MSPGANCASERADAAAKTDQTAIDQAMPHRHPDNIHEPSDTHDTSQHPGRRTQASSNSTIINLHPTFTEPLTTHMVLETNSPSKKYNLPSSELKLVPRHLLPSHDFLPSLGPSRERKNLVTLGNYPSTSFESMDPTSFAAETGSNVHLERPMTSPAAPRRHRNMKGLSIQPPYSGTNATMAADLAATPSVLQNLPALPPTSLEVRSDPKDMDAAKRKPSLLSLKTRAFEVASIKHNEVPQSPGVPPIIQRRALKHSTSTPQMLSGLKSCTFGPAGGMGFPRVLERNESGLSTVLRPIRTVIDPIVGSPIEDGPAIKLQLASRAQMDHGRHGEEEGHEDQRSPGYPDGPIAIYGNSVFLYMEPTAEEASHFDLVINVAREVRNPFHPGRDDFEGQDNDLRPQVTEANKLVITPNFAPDTATTQATFMTALEHQRTPTYEPEYVHMPWDHHTNISGDLMDLCTRIDDRVCEGKRVLVHCQQGASRSASLIIAYGMYRNPDTSVNDAYYAAQAQSKWISPNMKLMYCLQDFQKELARRRTPQPSANLRQRGARSPSRQNHGSTEHFDGSPPEPRTAPLPNSLSPKAHRLNPATHNIATDAVGDVVFREQQLTITTTGIRGVSPGPSSAPSCYSWPSSDAIKRQPPSVLDKSCRESSPLLSSTQSTISARNPESSTRALVPQISSFADKMSRQIKVTHSGGSGGALGPKSASIDSQQGGLVQDEHAPRQEPGADDNHHDHALLSPRAERMARKTFSDTIEINAITPSRVPSLAQIKNVNPRPHVRPETTSHSDVGLQADDGSTAVFSPRVVSTARQSLHPWARPLPDSDPRSPVTLGDAHIVRSIDEQIL
jgi:tyrosine-protein phosphatase